MNDHDLSSGGDAFTAEEQAQFDAYERGDEGGSLAPEPTAGAVEPPAATAPEPAPGTQPSEAAAPGDVVDPEDETGSAEENKGKFVRHGAFHQERERRKALEKELTDLRVQSARGDERLRLLMEASQRQPQTPAPAQPQAPAEPPKAIDPNEDIFGAYAQLREELEALKSGQTRLTEEQKQAQEAQRVERETNEVLDFYRGDMSRAVAADATMADAYEHLFSGRVRELMDVFGASQADAVKAVRAEEFEIAQSARQRGQSPAAVMMAIAKGRGFVAKAPAAEPAAPPAPAETAAEKAARTAAGQAGPGRSLSAAGGAPAGEITMEMLANMSEGDFEKLMASNPSRVRALMGG